MLLRTVLDLAEGFDGPLVVDVYVISHAGIGSTALFFWVVAVIVVAILARAVVGQGV